MAFSMPKIVLDAHERAKRIGFTLSSEDRVGQLLSTLSASVRLHGRILEIGTGTGVGTAWIVVGLSGRDDIELVSVEINDATLRCAQEYPWPAWVSFVKADVMTLYDSLGQFDLIFADAEGGKWTGLQRTVGLLRPGGMLLMDDMIPPANASHLHRATIATIRQAVQTDPTLVSVEFEESSGILLASRRV